RLPEPVLPTDEDDLAATARKFRESIPQALELGVAADRRRRRAGLVGRTSVDEPPRPHRAGASLDGKRTALLEHEPALEQPGRAARAARSGSPACAAGTPNDAQMPSPWYAWTVPPNSSTAPPRRVMHSPTSAFTSSGSRRSPSAVDPTMSAKSAVTGLTSSS